MRVERLSRADAAIDAIRLRAKPARRRDLDRAESLYAEILRSDGGHDALHLSACSTISADGSTPRSAFRPPPCGSTAPAPTRSRMPVILFAMGRPADALARYEAAHQVSSMKSSRAASILP
jgi:hypothetical protein